MSYTPKEYKALMLYLARRERLSRLQLLGNDISDNLVSERKVLTAIMGLETDMPSVQGKLYDYGALISQSQQGANQVKG